MLTERPKGDPNRTKTCACGAVVDVYDNSHQIEDCPAALALLTIMQWKALHEYVDRSVLHLHEIDHDDPTLAVDPKHKVDQSALIGFTDDDETWVIDPFSDITMCSQVNPVTYYGQGFIKSPFVTLARVVEKMLTDAYAAGDKVGYATGWTSGNNAPRTRKQK